MLRVACGPSSFVPCFLLLAVCSLFLVSCFLLVVPCFVLLVFRFLFPVFGFWVLVSCLLWVACCFRCLFGVCCVLSVVCCLLLGDRGLAGVILQHPDFGRTPRACEHHIFWERRRFIPASMLLSCPAPSLSIRMCAIHMKFASPARRRRTTRSSSRMSTDASCVSRPGAPSSDV